MCDVGLSFKKKQKINGETGTGKWVIFIHFVIFTSNYIAVAVVVVVVVVVFVAVVAVVFVVIFV